MAEQVETERKYDVPPDTPPLALSAPYALGPARAYRLRATYLDTLGLALGRAGCTLRLREGGDDEGWHLKLPRTGDSRREVHAPLSSGTTARVPEVLRRRVADVLDLEAVVPVARLDTDRSERDVLRDGRVVASLADDRVEATAAGGRTAWQEVEVELRDGTVDDLDAIEEQLRRLGLRRSTSASKVGRALAEVGPHRRASRAGTVVLAYLARQVGTLQGLETAVRADEPDAVHRARVATRRLRTTLRVYRRLFHREVTDPLRDEVRWLGEVLGAPRDAEVLRARLLEDVDALATSSPDLVLGPVRDRLDDTLSAEHRRGHEALVRVLDSPRYAALLESLVSLLVDPPLRGRADRRARKVLPRLARRAERRVRRARAAARRCDDPDRRAELVHEERKRAKAARYAWDALVPLVDGRAERASERWEAATEALGELQDTRVAVRRLAEIAAEAEAAGEPGFTYGVLADREAARGRDAQREGERHVDAALDG